MSTNAEKITAQGRAFDTHGTWSRHLIGPVELGQLLDKKGVALDAVKPARNDLTGPENLTLPELEAITAAAWEELAVYDKLREPLRDRWYDLDKELVKRRRQADIDAAVSAELERRKL